MAFHRFGLMQRYISRHKNTQNGTLGILSARPREAPADGCESGRTCNALPPEDRDDLCAAAQNRITRVAPLAPPAALLEVPAPVALYPVVLRPMVATTLALP